MLDSGAHPKEHDIGLYPRESGIQSLSGAYKPHAVFKVLLQSFYPPFEVPRKITSISANNEERKLQRGKRVLGEERIKKAHPMRKSLAECGTSFDTGVRRSKRIKMRPLEYWKGERFLFGRVDDSMKLIGVKYISPGKSDNDNMKVKPYILSESPDYKELLELAARH
ncbi:PREDICTED: uncharacterized protein LOC105975478 [Erythranthe guttata]|uniref:uncharacterized protein LOC105975478 n=1 Tax=Erythranthe guttata TaxID=4155 RepID=UPI00064DC0F8|nr:PREDICTED: uncharacterized protein LOC105975478 [Erythranthe guttata]|eukprot:XP_012856130.1 PREDICTED: uncharacterized protein LOC105975478 [Erythranthe guttata]